MASTPIANAARVTFRLVQDLDNEAWQYSFATHKRDEADWTGFLNAVESAYVSSGFASLSHGSDLVEIAYSEWETTGFTGFHQKLAVMESEAGSSGTLLPPQCACVVSLLDTLDSSDPIRRRRGRIYLGGLTTGNLDSGGMITSVFQAAVLGWWQDVDAAARTIPGPTGSDDFWGLCIASATGGNLYSADHIGVGLGVDTQRRRRRKVVEAISYVEVPA